METVYEVVRIRQEIRETKLPLAKVSSPSEVVDLVNQTILDDDREVFLVLMLNTRHDVVAVHRCHTGTLNASLVAAREVFKAAILNNAAGIVVAHNHPSGHAQPSTEDIQLTTALMEVGHFLGIPLLDHVIVGWQQGYYSFKASGLL